MKYEVMLKMENVNITDTETLINLVDQGWEHCANNKHHSFMVELCQFIEVESDPVGIDWYIKAINSVGGDITAVSYKEI